MPSLDRITSFLSENTLGVIIGALGVFFLLAFVVKGARDRKERQLRESTEAAMANGGTPDAPVHIGNPFASKPPPVATPPATPPPAPPSPAPQSPAPQSTAPQPSEGAAAQIPATPPAPPSGKTDSVPAAPAPATPAANTDEDKYVWE